MPVIDPFVLYQANGDSIASAADFATLVAQVAGLLDTTTDTRGWTVTIQQGGAVRAMPFKRALEDYLPDDARAKVVDALKATATASTKLAKWLNDQPANGEAEPAGKPSS